MNKSARYGRVYQQLSGLMATCPDSLARMATICAMLHHKFPYFFWTGFYLLKDGDLIVSVYQGPVACMQLARGQGVCWAGIRTGKTILVPDVHEFEGHIACDSRSKSEMVVPVFNPEGKLLGVFDADSDQINAFDQTDAEWVEKILGLIWQ